MVSSEKIAAIRTHKYTETIKSFIGDYKFRRQNWESPVFPAEPTPNIYPFSAVGGLEFQDPL
jgi:hypothetical protein